MFVNELRNIFLLFTAFLHCISAQTTPVRVLNGMIVGTTCSFPSTTVVAYLGIPYAQPPVGPLRWSAPVSYNSSYPNGALNASAFSASCYQFGSLASGTNYSEDCLYLNVWTPANATVNSSLPVKVWIYGGAFYAGYSGDPLYNGCGIATNSIVVSMNYRLGPLGWLTLNDSTGVTGNYGVLDVLLALQWVQDNIHSFGGNASTVLLFGQSAGGSLTYIISTLPQATSLISSAISESGAGRQLQTKSQQVAVGTTFINALGCANSINVVACIRGTSVAQIVAAIPQTLAILIYLPNRFNPHIDGTVIPVQPVDAGPKVPFVSGTCTTEGTLFTILSYPQITSVTLDDYISYLNSTFGTNLVPSILSHYPISKFNSTISPAFFAISAVLTDAEYTCPTRRALISALPTHLGTYTYLWNHVPSCPWTRALPPIVLPLLGPTHTSELAFVFGETTQLPRPKGTCQFTAYEQQLSIEITAAWQSMSKYGYPAFSNGTRWSDWSQGGTGVNFAGNITVGIVNATQCDFWDSLLSNNSTNTTSAARWTTRTTPPIIWVLGIQLLILSLLQLF